MFAEKISQGERVAVLTRPPPEKMHPAEIIKYEQIEHPLLKGEDGSDKIEHIEMAHPQAKGAEDVSYQVWPQDRTSTRTERVGERGHSKLWVVRWLKETSRDGVMMRRLGRRFHIN